MHVLNKQIELNFKRNAFNLIKQDHFAQKMTEFREKIKARNGERIETYKAGIDGEKDNLLELIRLAEAKLKEENQKKIRTKLKLDQIVLRGISQLNLEAIKLSHNSLNEIYRADYLKNIETSVKRMLFPGTVSSLEKVKQRDN